MAILIAVGQARRMVVKHMLEILRAHLGYFDGRARSLTVAAVVSGVLLASAYLGRRASGLPVNYILGGGGALILGLVALKDMSLALTVLVLSSATVNFSLGTGTQSPIVLAVMMVPFLTGVWLVRMLVQERRIELAPSPLNRPMLAFLVTAVVSWLAGYVIWNVFVPRPGNALLVQAGQYAMFALSFAACLLAGNHPIGESVLKRWTVFIIAVGIVHITWELWLARYPDPLPAVRGAMLMWPIVLLVAQLLFNPHLKPWLYMAGGLVLLVWLFWVRGELAYKSGWVPAMLGVGLLVLLRSKKLFVFIAAVGLVLAALNWNVFFSAAYLPEEGGSLLRPLIWWDVIRLSARSVLLGLGLVNYMYNWADPAFIPLSRIASGWETWSQWGYSPPSHNLFVDVFAQTGLIGLFFFTWVILASVRMGWRLRKRFAPGFMRAHVYGVLCGFSAITASSFVFADWLIPFVYNITIRGFQHSVYSWLLLGTLLSLEHFVKGEGGQVA